MSIYPRHFAAAMYSIEAFFLVASWFALASTPEEMTELIAFITADIENKSFYFAMAVVTVGAFLLAISFWLSGAARRVIAEALAISGVLLFFVSAWQLSMTLTVGFGIALWFAISNVFGLTNR